MIIGKKVNLRSVEIEDAEFILSLRCDDAKSKYLHKTDNNLIKQRQYIENKKNVDNEWYFIVERKDREKIGTYRIYDVQKESFCIGSWLMINGATSEEVLESDYLLREFGFRQLNLNKIHFDVRKENKKVIRYHKMMGAKVVGETDLDYLFECTKEDYFNNIKKFL